MLDGEIGVAHPHSGDLDEDLARSRIGEVQRLEGELRTDLFEDGGGNFHGRSFQ
jgi:hypothetical protein